MLSCRVPEGQTEFSVGTVTDSDALPGQPSADASGFRARLGCTRLGSPGIFG